MKKRFLAGVLLTAVFVSAQAGSVHLVQASETRVEESAKLLAEAVESLEEGTYVEGEALVSMEATEAAALAKEGTYRFDSHVKVESVSDFGDGEKEGKTSYIVHLTSDKYSTEELMELALGQYYVDGVGANEYRYLCAADTYKKLQWYLNGTGTDSKGIRFSKQQVTRKKTPVIAVIDTGVNYKHPDLAGSMWKNPYPDKLNGTCGYDFGEDDADPMDYNGHGTHVSGIAAATQNNGIGISGVANAKIMALKVVKDEDTDITDAAVINAFEYVYDALQAGVNVKAVNCSWGGSFDKSGLLTKAVNAIGKKGALSVFAAGNDAVNWDNVRGALATPYDLVSSYTVVVGASNEQDKRAYYSDYGAETVDVFAPGSNMLSTYSEDMYIPGIYDSALRRHMSLYYNKFSADSENILPAGQTWKNFYTAEQIGVPTDYTVKASVKKSGSNGYLKMEIVRKAGSNVSGGEPAGSVYVDVTDLDLDPGATYYVSYLDGAGRGSEMCWQAGNMKSTKEESRFVTRGEKTYMRIVGMSIPEKNAGKKNEFFLDDIAISVANPDSEQFGEYQLMEGTSMAAPVVSGALAVLGAANPNLSAKNLRGLLLKCVRKVSALSDRCITGGIIDMSKFQTWAAKVTLNKTNTTLRYGKTLTLKAKVSPSYATSTKVTWKSGNTKYATVNSKGVVKAKKAGIGHTVTVTATAADGSKRKASCKIKLKK